MTRIRACARLAAVLATAIALLLLSLPAPAQAGRAHEPERPPWAGARPSCPDGERAGPGEASCFPLRDARGKRFQRAPRGVPNLGEARRARRLREGFDPIEAPVPGGIGIGTLFQNGKLSVTSFAELETTVFVHPDGVEPSTANLEWLFSTSTNRTQKGVEFVAGYHADEPGWLGVFDWSCSAADPCAGGETGPSWIWSFALESQPEYLFPVYDDGGHLQDAVRYVNRTERLAGGGTPRWRNRVLLWNQAEQVWDLVYEHTYQTQQPDCSIDGCAWWGPILEDFRVDASLPLPEIRELGFQDTTLRHDGNVSTLGPAETSFVPPAAPWLVAHLDENGAYGAGNVFAGNPSPPPPPGPACGIGGELLLVLPLLAALRRRRR